MYERLDGKLWSGSGDSRAAKEIKKFKNHEVQIPKIADESWETLLAQLFWGQMLSLQKAMKKHSERMGQIQKRFLSHIVVARKSENSQ